MTTPAEPHSDYRLNVKKPSLLTLIVLISYGSIYASDSRGDGSLLSQRRSFSAYHHAFSFRLFYWSTDLQSCC